MAVATIDKRTTETQRRAHVSEAWEARQRGIGRVSIRTSWDICFDEGEMLVIEGREFGRVISRTDYNAIPEGDGSDRVLLIGSRCYLLEMNANRYWGLHDEGLISIPLMYGQMIAGRPGGVSI